MNLDMIMSTDLITISPETSLAAAHELMNKNSIHHLPVVVDWQLVGLVSLSNILAATDSILRDADSQLKATDILVKDFMVTEVLTIDESASLRRAAIFMEKHRIGCLPVISNGRLHGIVTDTDFVAVAINLLEQIEDAEPLEESDADGI